MTTEFDFNKQQIAISDAASMLRHKINKNEKPYTQNVMKYNNKLVDECYNQLWMKICSNNLTLQSSKVWDSWNVFKEGKELTTSMDRFQMFTRLDDDKVKYWIDYFNQDLDDLLKDGMGRVKVGWESLMTEFRLRVAEEKYRAFYMDSEDPVVWWKNAIRRKDLTEGTYYPFWSQDGLRDAVDKVRTIMSVQVTPNN